MVILLFVLDINRLVLQASLQPSPQPVHRVNLAEEIM